MKIMYTKGKRCNHGFMAFAEIAAPEDYNSKLPVNALRFCFYRDNILRFYRRENCLKTILRLIRKQNYPVGTLVVVSNWYVGYADLVIII